LQHLNYQADFKTYTLKIPIKNTDKSTNLCYTFSILTIYMVEKGERKAAGLKDQDGQAAEGWCLWWKVSVDFDLTTAYVRRVGTQMNVINPFLRILKGEKFMNSRWLIAIMLLISGCVTDPGAVTSFSALAPDASKLHSLTTAYADAPNQLKALDVLQYTAMSADETAEQVKARNAQVAQIDALHAILVNYMQSLGALANNGLVQTSADTKDVTDGLTALSKNKPDLGLTPNMITGIGDLVTLLADAATSFYRQDQLTSIIGRSDAPFQQLVAAEKKIVSEGVIKELQLVEDRTKALAEVTHALKVNADAEAAKSMAPQVGDTGVKGLNPKLQGSGAADIASLYLLQQLITSNLNNLDLQIKAATAYLTALDKIADAHTVLYKNRDDLLTKKGAKTAISQLTPLVKDANAALEALKNM